MKRASAARVRVSNADVFDPSLDLSGNGTTNQFEWRLSAKPSVGSWHAWLCPRQDQSSEDPPQDLQRKSKEPRAKIKAAKTLRKALI